MIWAAAHDGKPHAPSMVVLTLGLLMLLGGVLFWLNAKRVGNVPQEQADKWHRAMTGMRWSGVAGKIVALAGVPVVIAGAVMWLAAQ